MLNKYVWISAGFPYLCSNSVKLDELDELEKTNNDNVETLQG